MLQKTFLIIALLLSTFGVFAQHYEAKNTGKKQVLFINGKKFTGPRQEIWKFEKNLAPQPVSSELVLLSTMESTETDVWQYFLYRFIDNEWEYVTNFPGGTAPIVTLKDGMFTAFQWNGAEKINYTIDEVMLTSYPSQRRWMLREVNP